MRNERQAFERFTRDPVGVRLGNLSSDLARVANLIRKGYLKPVRNIIREAEFFIEWTCGNAPTELQPELVVIQVQLARWWLCWSQLETDPESLDEVAACCYDWADSILSQSGLTVIAS